MEIAVFSEQLIPTASSIDAPLVILYEQPELICQTDFTGKEPGGDLPVLLSTCKTMDRKEAISR